MLLCVIGFYFVSVNVKGFRKTNGFVASRKDLIYSFPGISNIGFISIESRF